MVGISFLISQLLISVAKIMGFGGWIQPTSHQLKTTEIHCGSVVTGVLPATAKHKHTQGELCNSYNSAGPSVSLC